MRANPLFFVLATITVSLSSWGLYRLFVDFAGMPGLLAVVSVGGLDLVAVLCGKQALTVAGDGDSSVPWTTSLLLFTALAAFAQFSHARLAGQPTVIGVTMAAFPVATVLLFEGQLRRHHRVRGRAAGRLAAPRATFDLSTWLLYRKLAMTATKLAVLDRDLDASTALVLAERQLAVDTETDTPPRRTFRRTYDHLTSDAAVEQPAIAVPSTRVRTGVAAAVRAARTTHGDDLDTVLAAVRTSLPDADRDTVRRTLARLNNIPKS